MDVFNDDFPASAYQVEPVVQQHMPEVSEYVARGGAAPVSGVSCGATCTDLWTTEQAASRAESSSIAFLREADSVRRGTGVLPRWSALGEVTLAVEAFDIGWAIGTGIYEKFFSVHVPPVNPATGYIYDYRNIKAKPCNQTWEVCIAPGSPAGAQFYFNTDYYQGGTWRGNTSFVDPRNPFHYWPPVPAPFTPYSRQSDGWQGGVLFGFESDGVRDYTGQSADRQTPSWSGVPSSAQDLSDRIRNAIQSGQAQVFEQQIAARLDPQNQDQGTKKDEDCDPGSGGTGQDPAPERGVSNDGTEFEARYEKVPGSIAPSSGFPTVHGATYLRWGYAIQNTSNEQIAFKGFGYRKIKAKHGWDQADLEATTMALQDPVPTYRPTQQYLGADTQRYEYVGPQYNGRSGAVCVRFVVVNHAQSAAEAAAGMPPAGIVTSFGRRVN